MRRLVLVLVLLGPWAAADEIFLVNGRRLSCEILEITDERVKVRLPHGTLTFPRAKVDRIVREASGTYLKREADKRLDRGATKDAVAMYQRALDADPRDAAARAGLLAALAAHARALTDEFRLADAADVVRRLAALDPGHPEVAGLAERIRREHAAGEAMYAQAEAAAKRGDYRRALAALDRWRLRRPVDDPVAREALAGAQVGAAYQALEAGDLRKSIDHFRAARGYGERRRTEEALYLLRPIAVLEALKVGDAEEARRLLDGIATTYPDAAVPVFLRAVRHHVLGEVDDAVAAYAESARLAAKQSAPPKGLEYKSVKAYASATLRASIARPPQEGVKRWRELFLGPLVRDAGARHFVVYAPTAETAAAVAAAADEAYAAIARDLMGRVPPGAPAEVVVHPSRQAYDAADPSPPGNPIAGVTIARGLTRGVCYQTVDADGGRLIRVETFLSPELMADTLPHELVHVVQRRGLAAYRRGHWLDEGLAMLYESEPGRANRTALWRQMRGNRIPLPEFLALKSTPPGRIALFYNQAHAFAGFVRGLGDERDWQRFLGAFGRGDFEEAIRTAYAIESVEDLERRWIAGG